MGSPENKLLGKDWKQKDWSEALTVIQGGCSDGFS